LRVALGLSNYQCEIIHGRLPGKLLAPLFPLRVMRDDFPEQHAQPAPWLFSMLDKVDGAWALRSLVAWASLRSADSPDMYGAVR
jgi:hypothetical protein